MKSVKKNNVGVNNCENFCKIVSQTKYSFVFLQILYFFLKNIRLNSVLCITYAREFQTFIIIYIFTNRYFRNINPYSNPPLSYGPDLEEIDTRRAHTYDNRYGFRIQGNRILEICRLFKTRTPDLKN